MNPKNPYTNSIMAIYNKTRNNKYADINIVPNKKHKPLLKKNHTQNSSVIANFWILTSNPIHQPHTELNWRAQRRDRESKSHLYAISWIMNKMDTLEEVYKDERGQDGRLRLDGGWKFQRWGFNRNIAVGLLRSSIWFRYMPLFFFSLFE